jgi:hypothetical protein
VTVEKVIPAFVTSTLVDGDLFYWQTDEFKRLAAGSNTHVLTLAGGLPTWAAAAGGGGLTTYRCSLEKQADQTITGNSVVTFGAGSELFDARGYHDTSTNTERITIPDTDPLSPEEDASGLYLVSANLRWDNDTSGGRQVDLSIYDDSSATTKTLHYVVHDSGSAYANPATLTVMWDADILDYVYIKVWESSTGTPDVKALTTLWVLRLD